MTTSVLRSKGEEIDFLRLCLRNTEQGAAGFGNAIRVVLKEQSWARRRDPKDGHVYECASFAEFVTASPLRGLGWMLEDMRALCQQDPELLEEFDKATTRPKHLHADDDNIIIKTEQGTSPTYALRRLRKNRPDLHEMVLSGELSPHAAMVEAGFRHKTATVAVDDPEKIAAFLNKFDDEMLDAILALVRERGKKRSAA